VNSAGDTGEKIGQGILTGGVSTINDFFDTGPSTLVPTPEGAGASSTTGVANVQGTGGPIVPPPARAAPVKTPQQIATEAMSGSTVTGVPPPAAPAPDQVSTAAPIGSPFGGNSDAAAAYNKKYGTNK
jgi:hypothetical protein